MECVLIHQSLFVWINHSDELSMWQINCSDKLSVWRINRSHELRVAFNIASQWSVSNSSEAICPN